MFKRIKVIFISAILTLTGCALQPTTIEVNPVYGMSLAIPSPLAKRIRMAKSEISFLGKDSFNGFIEVVELPHDIPKGLPAIDVLIQETAKGSAPVQRLDLGKQAAGYAVHIEGVSTMWIVSEDAPSSLVVISISNKYFNQVVESLKF